MTDGLAEAGEPVFDHGGKYLYFLASTDAGPVNNWFDQSFTDMQATATVYLVTLAKATANPLLKESDEEGTSEAAEKERPPDDKAKDKKRQEKKKTKRHEKEKEKPATVVIDLDGITAGSWPCRSSRGIFEIWPPGRGPDLLHPPWGPAGPGPARGKPSLRRFDLKKREEETLAEGIDDFQLSADRKKILYSVRRVRLAVGLPRARPPWASSTRANSPRETARSTWGRSRCESSPRRMGPDLARSLADQPRLLLRHQHAWGRLERHPAEIRRSSSPTWRPGTT